MRNGQNKRMRGRNRKSHNPMARVYELNGPDVKIRGNPSHIAEKYMQLARDAQSSGDPVAAENYYQHAEHYYRLIAAAQEQFRQNNPHFSRPESPMPGARDDAFDDGEDDGQQPRMGGSSREPYGTGEQPYLPRDAQPYPQHQQPQPHQPRHQGGGAPAEGGGDVDRLPSFITGGQAPQHASGATRATDRMATTTSPTGSRCIAADAAIAAARATTCRAAARIKAPAATPTNPRRASRRHPQAAMPGARSGPSTSSSRLCEFQAPPGEGASAGSSAGTSRWRSRRAGIAR